MPIIGNLPPQDVKSKLENIFAAVQKFPLHDSIRRKYPGMEISGIAWFKIFAASLFFGSVLYGGVVIFSYWHTARAMQVSEATFALPWRPDSTAEMAAAVTLDDLGIAGDNDLKAELRSAMEAVRATKGNEGINHLPALALATRLVMTTIPGSCATCRQDCELAWQPVLSRMLLGWPMNGAGRAADVAFLQKQIAPPDKPSSSTTPNQKAKDEACETVASLRGLRPSASFRLLAGRQEPWPAPLVAQLVLGADNCISTANQLSRDRCVLVTRLLQAVIDNADVKSDRAFLVDFFYGWERAAVSILIFIVGLAILRQRKARKRLELESDWVQNKLNNRDLKRGLDPLDEDEMIPAPMAAIALRDSFVQSFSPKFDGTGQEPVAEIVVATAEAVSQEDLEYLQAFVDRNLTELEASRELINSIITIFPVIGFSATLLSLVSALAGANQIATSSGDLRSAAILNITSLLSSCFATTFLALVSMAIFVVLNLLETGKDRRLITTLSERLISSFRPGRNYR